MRLKEFFTLLSHGPRLIAGVLFGNTEEIDRIEQETREIHARIRARRNRG